MMIHIGLTISLFAFIAVFYIGACFNKMESYQFFISILIVFIMECVAIFCIIDDVEKYTLLDYENGNIGYKVTEIHVESNKATDIEVIHHPNPKETE